MSLQRRDRTAAWTALHAAFAAHGQVVDLRDAGRFQRLSLEAPSVVADLSKIELGKALCNALLPRFATGDTRGLDASTAGLSTRPAGLRSRVSPVPIFPRKRLR
jgi:hypothetical protein